jgi:hypothetical protein
VTTVFLLAGFIQLRKALFQDIDPPGEKKEISDHLPLWAEFREICRLSSSIAL